MSRQMRGMTMSHRFVLVSRRNDVIFLRKMMHQRQLKKSPTNYGSNLCHTKIDNIEKSNIRSRVLSNRTTSTTLPSTSPSSSSRSSSRSTLFISSLSLNRLSSSTLLLSVLAWSVTLLLISSCIGFADAAVLYGHPLGKRSFSTLQCKGVYDKSIFARLDRICEDCYNLFREPQLHTLCRKECFSSKYFNGCLQSLLLDEEKDKYREMADYLGRK
ncbi:crustacean hyperglycemic hormones 4-like isoform X2 [Aphidius gifuensis]|uniref:crustacean hyperglycemic hormones 4-like isoform X2 n=2 Tax=Aphidius gifuensis TaxID=684658 RepID=UPI001CDD4D73|nr:crustacean hyperglycemic hormones 4-like isoform X2 [Aphidius gifuensis]